jgi:hypothetical protein
LEKIAENCDHNIDDAGKVPGDLAERQIGDERRAGIMETYDCEFYYY